MASQKAGKASFPSFRRKPESRFFEQLQDVWTPVTLSRRKPGTGVTTSCEAVNFDGFVKSRRTAFRSWFDTSPRTENQILTVYLIRSPCRRRAKAAKATERGIEG
jgi:hypothetical protein